MRVYLKVIFGNSLANSVSSKIGFLKHCHNCNHRKVENLRDQDLVCGICDTKCKLAGPLWIDSLFDFEFAGTMLTVLKNDEYFLSTKNEYNKLLRMMQICNSELAYPFYFETDSIASKVKKSSISLDKVIGTLTENGFNASKTIMNDKGFKTNATLKEIIDLLYK